MKREIKEPLLKKARIKERNYNFEEAAGLYEQAAENFLTKNLLEEAAKTFNQLGLVYSYAFETAKTSEKFINNCKNGIKAYEMAKKLFIQIGNHSNVLECEANTLYINSFISGSIIEAKNNFIKSSELFIECSNFYEQEDNKEAIVRSLCSGLKSLSYALPNCKTSLEVKEILQKVNQLGDKSWKLSKEIKVFRYLGTSFYFDFTISSWVVYALNFKSNDRFYKYLKNLFLKFNEFFELVGSWDDPRVLGMVFLASANAYCVYGNHYAKDENEQGEYIDKGIELFEKALIFAKKAKNSFFIIQVIFWLNWWAFFNRRLKYVQKRIFNDVNELLNLGKVYIDTPSFGYYLTNLLPAFYYANIAQLNMFTSRQRISYAKKGVEYAKKSLKFFSNSHLAIKALLMLTYSYSQLTALTTSKEEQEEYSNEMLDSAKRAKEIGERFEGGLVRGFSYNSLYRTYRTLADISEDKEKKLKMLLIAAQASKDYMKHTMEIITGNLMMEMRLGLLYEEISIIAGKSEYLDKAKMSFFKVARESIERGYYYYAAAANEYIARMEDRLGNYSASAEHYEKTFDTHKESLKLVKYKPLILRINEKINYAYAWSLIERSKTYHKRENHLQAIETYKKACKILNVLSRYKHEADYYSAWILLEEAEHFSKQEMHKMAIEKYEATIKAFENAAATLKKSTARTKNKIEKERISKIEKLAILRIKHCAARINIERARILGKQGEHLAAAEKFSSAAAELIEVCNRFTIERERDELKAGYYLCRAWKSMAFAEYYGDSNKFAEAAELFERARTLFSSNKMKSLASGNSSFCQALKIGCKFDEITEATSKAKLYPKIKIMLRNAASSYRKGGFENGADWALATSSYFDAAWYLIRADEEIRLEEKKKLLDIGSEIFKSASELFGKAGYKEKEKEVLKQLDMLKKEESIIISALNAIKKPSISGSTIGISAPTCPLETSESPRLGEIRELTETATKIKEDLEAKPSSQDELKLKEKRKIPEHTVKEKIELEKLESELNIEEQQFICIVHKGQIVGTVYICPNCKTCYCLTCAYSLKANGEKCWVCNNEIKP
jgi:tetratricopeptide (TPR) repeat protein